MLSLPPESTRLTPICRSSVRIKSLQKPVEGRKLVASLSVPSVVLDISIVRDRAELIGRDISMEGNDLCSFPT